MHWQFWRWWNVFDIILFLYLIVNLLLSLNSLLIQVVSLGIVKLKYHLVYSVSRCSGHLLRLNQFRLLSLY